MGHDRARGVEHDRVAHRALGAGQHRAGLRGVGDGIPALQVLDLGAREPKTGGIEFQLVHRSGLHPPDGAGRGGGQLVEAVVAVHHQHAGLPRGEHSRHHLGEIGECTADQPGPWPPRIGKRPKQIEDRRHADLPPNRRCVPIRRVKLRCEAEADSDLGNAARDIGGVQVDADAESFQGVSAAGQRRRRPVAMFDHRDAGGRHHDRRHRGQVDRADSVAAGADHVDGVGSDLVGGQAAAVLQHHVGQLGHFR